MSRGPSSWLPFAARAVALVAMALLGAAAADEDVAGPSALDTDAVASSNPIASLSDWPGSRQLQQQPTGTDRDDRGEESTAEPTEQPTDEEEHREEPTEEPTEEPVSRQEPTEEPMDEEEHREEPTEEPTEEPVSRQEPTEEPTEQPKREPKPEPTEQPMRWHFNGTNATNGTTTTTYTTRTSTTTDTKTLTTRTGTSTTTGTVTTATRTTRTRTSETGTTTTYTSTTTDTLTTGTSATDTWRQWYFRSTSTTTCTTFTQDPNTTSTTSTGTSTISTGTSTTTDTMTTNTFTTTDTVTTGTSTTTYTTTTETSTNTTYTSTNTTTTHTATSTTYTTVTSTTATTTEHTTTATSTSTTSITLTTATSTAFTDTSATAYGERGTTSGHVDPDDPEATTTAAGTPGTDIPAATYTVTSATSVHALTDLPRTTSTRTTSNSTTTDATTATGTASATTTTQSSVTTWTTASSITETNTSTATTATATTGTSTSTLTATVTTATATTATTTATRTAAEDQAALVSELQQAVRQAESQAVELLTGGAREVTIEGAGVVVTARKVNVTELAEPAYTFWVPGQESEARVPKSVLALIGDDVICSMAVYKEDSSAFTSSDMEDLGLAGAPLDFKILDKDGQPLQGTFAEPILLTLLPSRPEGAKCAYWDEANERWWNDGVNLVDDVEGRFVCATTHLTLFAAFLGEFKNLVACSNAKVFTEEGFRSLAHPTWWYKPPMIMVWVIVAVQIIQLAVTIYWDVQLQRQAPWDDKHFFTDNVAYKQEGKWLDFQRLAGPGKLEKIRREVKEVLTGVLMTVTLQAAEHQSRIASGDLKRILKATTAKNGDIMRFGSKAGFATAAHEKSIAAIRHFQSLDFLHRTMMMFVTLHPWVRLSHYSIRVVYSIRAVMLSVKLFGALLMTAVFFDAGDGMASFESPPECELSGVWELVYKNIVIGLASAFLAAVPLLLIYQMSSRTFTYKENWEEVGSQGMRRKKMLRWRLEDSCIVGLGVLFCSFALLFVMTFLANMGQSSTTETKFIISSITLLVEFLFLTPVLMALAYVTIVWAAARCWPDTHATVQRRLGLIAGTPKGASGPPSPVVAWVGDAAHDQHEPDVVCDVHISDIDSDYAESPGALRAAAQAPLDPPPEIVVTEPLAIVESAQVAPLGSRPVPRQLSPLTHSPHTTSMPLAIPSPHTPALPPVPPRAFDSLWKSLTKRQEQEMRILVLGPEAAGKTTLLSVLAFGAPRAETRIAGVDAETATFNNMVFVAVDVGNQRSCSALLQHSDCKNAQGIIFVVDSGSYEDIELAREEFMEALAASPGLPLLVFANKQDLPGALGAGAVAERLALNGVEDRLWHVQPSSGRTGTGICEGRGWLWCALTSRSAPSSPAAPNAAVPSLFALGN